MEKLSNEQFSLKFRIFSNKTYLIISLSKYTASQERIRLQNQGKVFINNNGEFEKKKKFFLRTARKQFLKQTKKKFYIESLSPEEKLSNEQFSLKFRIFSNKTYLIISLSKYTASQERIRLQNQGKVFINNNGEFEKISNRLWSFLCHFVSTVFSQTKYIQKPPQHQNIRND